MDGFDDDGEWTSDGGLERVLRAAFRAQAGRAVSDFLEVPAMSDPVGPATHRSERSPRRRRLAWAIPIAAAVVAAAVIVPIALVSHNRSTTGTGTVAGPAQHTSARPTVGLSTSPVASPSSTKHAGPPPKIVKVTSDLNDGDKVGVGEPILLNFTPSPTNSTAFTKAVTVTVDGKPATGAWYWEQTLASRSRPTTARKATGRPTRPSRSSCQSVDCPQVRAWSMPALSLR